MKLVKPDNFKYKATDILFKITVEDVQIASQRILGKKLTDDELIIFEDRLNDGICNTLDITYNALFEEFR